MNPKENYVPTDAEKETVIETEPGKNETDSKKLAEDFLANQEKIDKLNKGKVTDSLEYQKTLDSIKNDPEKKDKSNEEVREEHRKEFITRAFQMMIDNLQAKVDDKGIFGWMNPKKELDKAISGLIWEQGQHRDRLILDMKFALTGDGSMVDNKVKKQIARMVKDEFDPEDQQCFTGDESVQNQVKRGMSEVTKG